MSCLNVDVQAALRLQEDELTNDVFGVWFTFVCCAVNKQSWSKKPNSSGSTCRGLYFCIFFFLVLLERHTATKIR